MRIWSTCPLILAAWLVAVPSSAQQRFAELVGDVKVQPVAKAAQIEVPYITWGGDVATFLANDGLTTRQGSIYGKMGLNLKLVAGDDFVGQVKNYLSGKTPFLRGTFRMIGQASEVLGTDPRTKPVVILQLSWSKGDHIVARDALKTLNDLKSKTGKKVKIACQQGGPHVGLIDDVLRTAKISWDDVQIEWCKDLTGAKGPAELFRKDPTVDACCVISPDMIGLTGGLEEKGTGAEGTVKGARVLVSTMSASRSIADVYAVRSDWFEANQAMAGNFVAGYLKATEEVVRMRNEFQKTGKMSPDYRKLLTRAREIFGEEVLPSLEVDAHGLLMDCGFVGLPGNISFFKDKGNLNGFDAKLKVALDLAVSRGYAKARTPFVAASLDYQAIAKLAGIEYVEPEIRDFPPPPGEGGEVIVSFTIHFEPNQFDFPPEQYGSDFDRALQAASTFGASAMIIRGHSDPTKTLVDLIRAGMAKGTVRRSGSSGDYKYYIKTEQGSEPLDLNQTRKVAELIEAGAFDGVKPSPRQTMQAALNLSLQRAEAVKKAMLAYASQRSITFNEKQFQVQGMGVLEPLISRPRNIEEAKQNMRVEFRIVRVPAEVAQPTDFDY